MFLLFSRVTGAENSHRISGRGLTCCRAVAILCTLGFFAFARAAMADDTKEGIGNRTDRVAVTFTVAGIPDDVKAKQGVLVPVNDDWDEENRSAAGATPPNAKLPDLANNELKAADDDPLSVGLRFEGTPPQNDNERAVAELHGTWALDYDDTKMKVWRSVPGQTGVWTPLPKNTASADVSLAEAVDVALKVEGLAPSTAFKSNSIKAVFTLADDQGRGSASLITTIYKLDLTLAGTSELEEQKPGVVVIRNGNNDEGNRSAPAPGGVARPDYMEDSVVGHRIVDGDNEVETLQLSLLPKDLHGKWKVEYTDTLLKVWTSANVLLPSGQESAEVTVPENGLSVALKAEGIGLGTSNLKATFKPTDYPVDCLEVLKTVVAPVDLDSDTDQSGSVDGNDSEDRLEETAPGSIVLVNCDDDNGDQKDDGFDNFEVDGADDVADLATLVVRALPAELPEDATVRIICSDLFNVFDARTIAGIPFMDVGPPADARYDYDVERPYVVGSDGTFGLEAVQFPPSGTSREQEIRLEVSFRGKVYKDTIKVTIAPFMLQSNLQPSERIYVSNADADFKAELAGIASTLETADMGLYNDVWLQDEVEIGYAKAPYNEMKLVLDMPRDRGLDPGLATSNHWPEDELRRQDQGRFGIDDGAGGLLSIYSTNSAHYGGNLELIPPTNYAGGTNKRGRIVLGANMSSIFTNKLEEHTLQGAEGLIKLPVSWLVVGHVDEIISIIPNSNRPLGFSIGVADTTSAYTLLGTLKATATGTVASAGASTLTVAGNPWSADQWRLSFVEITSGTGAGQVRRIANSGTNNLTVSRNWLTTPDATSQFKITGYKYYLPMFSDDEGGLGKQDWGVATGGTANTLVDTTKSWVTTPDKEWRKSSSSVVPDSLLPGSGGPISRSASAVRIVAGTGVGQARYIADHTGNTITIEGTWDTNPDETSIYVLEQLSLRTVQTDAQFAAGQPNLPSIEGANEVYEDGNYRSINATAQGYIDAAVQVLKGQLNLTDADFVKIPALFHKPIDTSTGGTLTNYAGHIPDMVNMQIDGTQLMVPRPFGVRIGGQDIFASYVNGLLGTSMGNTVHFVRTYEQYHNNIGESHCGTNATRTVPAAKWWE